MYLLTIGDSGYFKTILYSIYMANDIHPEVPVVIYDWGFSDDQLEMLYNAPNVEDIIKWRFVQEPVPFKINTHEWKLAQKPYCYSDFIRKYNSAFLFLDGDAYIIDKIPELLSDKFSIGITLRRIQDQVFDTGKCRVINSGVFVLNNLGIIDKWIARMQKTQERLVEQTALTRLIYNDRAIDDYKEFSCEEYNYYWVNSEIPKTAKILHLKGRGAKKKRGLLK